MHTTRSLHNHGVTKDLTCRRVLPSHFLQVFARLGTLNKSTRKNKLTYLVIVCKDGIELFRGQLDTLQTKGSVGTNVIWRMFNYSILQHLKISILYTFYTTTAVALFFQHHSVSLPGIWARNSPVQGEACGREGLYYWTQKWLIIQILGRENEHQPAVRFNIYPENRKRKEVHITSPSLTDPASHLHSDQTSEATKWKQNIDKRGTEGNGSKKSKNSICHSQENTVGVNEFHWVRRKIKAFENFENCKISQLTWCETLTAGRRGLWGGGYANKLSH